MSKPDIEGQSILPDDSWMMYLAMEHRHQATEAAFLAVQEKASQHELNFTIPELYIISALDTPDKIQHFLNTYIYYNDDHGDNKVRDETSYSPLQVLHGQLAHCFEGALFAYMVSWLHGMDPKLVLLESREDFDHNIVVVRGADGKLRSIAHSRYEGLDGKLNGVDTLKVLVSLYAPHYYNDKTGDRNDIRLAGFSNEVDLIDRFGTSWMDKRSELWNMYYLYIDGRDNFWYLTDHASSPPHLYPLVRAVQEGWIHVTEKGQATIDPQSWTDAQMRELWNKHFKLYNPEEHVQSREAMECAAEFLRLTGTTPLDLQANVSEYQAMLDHGFQPPYAPTNHISI